MIQIHSIDIYDNTGKDLLYHESFENSHIANEALMEMWQSHQDKMWTQAYGQQVRVITHHTMRPQTGKTPVDICQSVCFHRKQKYNDVVSSKKDRDLTLTRKYVTNICLEAGYTPNEIEKYLWASRIYVFHKKSLKALMQTDPRIRVEYDELKDIVMMKIR